MISTKAVSLLLSIAGWVVFLTPQSLPRRWVEKWSRGYSFVFWLTKVVALTMIVLGMVGLLLGK